MAHAWNACWVHALGGSNPPSSATGRPPVSSSSHEETGGFLYGERSLPQEAELLRLIPLCLQFRNGGLKASAGVVVEVQILDHRILSRG